MLRYVILLHEMPANTARPTHFDLMLEQNGVLRTWAMTKLPPPGEILVAEQLADHRLAYLEYEGQISGDRGRVTRIAAGHFNLIAESDTQLAAQLHGETLSGTLILARDDHETHLWRVSFVPV
jgi:hypothetical protein